MRQLHLYLPAIWIVLWAILWTFWGGDTLMVAGLLVLAFTLYVHVKEIIHSSTLRRNVHSD